MNHEENQNITYKKLFVIFSLSLVANFLGSWFGYAMTHNQMLTQAILGLILPFANLFYTISFIEAKSLKDRLKLTLASALALSIGSTLMLILQSYLELK
jgi:FtsH-binding integral membrane protein